MLAPGEIDMMETRTTTKDNCTSGGHADFMRPWLAKAEFWKQCRENGNRFEIDPSTEFESRTINTQQNATKGDEPRPFRFLDLPAEIRMQIYHWLHIMSPVRHAQLAPWYPIPAYSNYIISPITEDSINAPDQEHPEEGAPPRAPSPEEQRELDGMLSPFRPLSALPSNLLRANSKVYFEARAIPFENNEFVFVNWFTSGLWTAKAFTAKLSGWQRVRVRYVRLEMMFRDFTDQGFEAWVMLCEAWAASMRGLRLKISFTSCQHGKGLWEARAKQIEKWIGAGVERLGKLERLELELSTEEMDDAAKVEVCKGLEEAATRGVVVVAATRKGRCWTR